ncbi:fumarylacetoacetate hydrolase family protein [Sulfurihydrogenibium subterraneum]|uniref:fumarylacetoacetate hydrolase family protein n=1 Tax=Sulfurihydrogenibium subterraneum TaxID=171121 RepID=UPI00048AEDD5|nr:fumarylacetoacetate hydrolase family protein [Sulfurihydrogenibium subterraneum]
MKSVIFEDKEVIPSKVLCVGRNYVEHIYELKNQIPDEIVLFIKPNSAISNRFIKPKGRCRYEGEISFIVEDGKYVGVGFGIDLTLVEEQEKAKKKSLPWEKAKAFDNSGIFSKFVRIDNFYGLEMKLFKNGDLVQFGSIDLMINKPDDILSEIKKYFSLEDYDIVMTGTPKGVGDFEVGDEFIGQILKYGKVLVEERWIVEKI